MGALHPVLFFAVMYVVVLFLSIFICSSIFYSVNGSDASADLSDKKQSEQMASSRSLPMPVASAVAVR